MSRRRAAADDAVEREAEELYREILRRAPEHRIEPTLDRVASLMTLLGDPQHSFRTVHVTGTNGKTSTSRMIERLIREMGLRTGLLTSPHLHTVRERMVIDGEPITPARFVETWRDIEPYVAMVDERLEAEGQNRLNFFEVLTALGYAAFADAPVDVAVVEVGMGGEWDSTNTIDAEVAVFAPISRDHERWLGHGLDEIATVKAGIIKQLDPPQVVITAEQPEAAAAVIAERARQRGARLVAEGVQVEVANRVVAVGGQLIDLRGTGGLYTEIFLPLHGAHQAANAAVALAAVEAFFGAGPDRQLDVDAIRSGFASVSSPGRLERLRSAPTVFADAAHNPHGAAALAQALAEEFDFRRLVGVVGVLGDKDARGLLEALEPVFDMIVVTDNGSPRALDPETLAEYAHEVFGEDRVVVKPFLPDAVEEAIALAEEADGERISGAGVVITGSVVTAGAARTLFNKEPT